MKLRIFANTIRWRLSRGEVAKLAHGTALQESTPLAPQSLRYSLTTSNDTNVARARFADGVLEVMLPLSAVHDWAESDEVGLTQQISSEAGVLRLLVEKDLECLHGEAEGQEDCYPNPMAATARR
ncbi:MAG TPA: hypothetical protein VH518_07265 [Tepidisphaeraceae bacterium]|jgi:hypothetical protein